MRPATQCTTILRTGECVMPKHHRGRHTTVAFYCDVCGNTRRGTAIPIIARIAPYETEHVADMCFLCQRGLTPAMVEARKDQYA